MGANTRPIKPLPHRIPSWLNGRWHGWSSSVVNDDGLPKAETCVCTVDGPIYNLYDVSFNALCTHDHDDPHLAAVVVLWPALTHCLARGAAVSPSLEERRHTAVRSIFAAPCQRFIGRCSCSLFKMVVVRPTVPWKEEEDRSETVLPNPSTHTGNKHSVSLLVRIRGVCRRSVEYVTTCGISSILTGDEFVAAN